MDRNSSRIIRVQIDGKSIGNPGRAFSIAHFENGEDYFWKGVGTNNEAEYHGLMLALENAPKDSEVLVETDSSLLAGQMKQGWKINYAHLRELNERCRKLIREKNLKFGIRWIPREKNKADRLLNEEYRRFEKTGRGVNHEKGQNKAV